ncbi:MAG: hypothetical protein H0U25_13095 [Thermoleophilaceae bacterium]|nr:hypothetical protein [Thermoleophilaceae bacterium]
MWRVARVSLLVFLYAVWLIVPLTVWGAGYSDGGGLDGPCISTGEWATKHLREGYSSESHAQLWPPGSVRCEIETPTGSIERVFPGNVTYAITILLVLLPFALRPLARRSAAMAQINRPPPR